MPMKKTNPIGPPSWSMLERKFNRYFLQQEANAPATVITLHYARLHAVPTPHKIAGNVSIWGDLLCSLRSDGSAGTRSSPIWRLVGSAGVDVSSQGRSNTWSPSVMSLCPGFCSPFDSIPPAVRLYWHSLCHSTAARCVTLLLLPFDSIAALCLTQCCPLFDSIVDRLLTLLPPLFDSISATCLTLLPSAVWLHRRCTVWLDCRPLLDSITTRRVTLFSPVWLYCRCPYCLTPSLLHCLTLLPPAVWLSPHPQFDSIAAALFDCIPAALFDSIADGRLSGPLIQTFTLAWLRDKLRRHLSRPPSLGLLFHQPTANTTITNPLSIGHLFHCLYGLTRFSASTMYIFVVQRTIAYASYLGLDCMK